MRRLLAAVRIFGQPGEVFLWSIGSTLVGCFRWGVSEYWVNLGGVFPWGVSGVFREYWVNLGGVFPTWWECFPAQRRLPAHVEQHAHRGGRGSPEDQIDLAVAVEVTRRQPGHRGMAPVP